jgi:AcrR family transcriptional regulator
VVPLRDIGIAAGQKNSVDVQYHFRDRENLLHEIATYRFTSARPIRAQLEDGAHYLAFLSRYARKRGGYQGLEDTSVGSNIHTFMALIHRLPPDLPFEVVQERWLVMMTSSIHSLARFQNSMKSGTLKGSLPELLDDLIAFLAAVLMAALLGTDQQDAGTA